MNWGPNWAARFHRLHEQRYGYSDTSRPLEIVSLRVRMVAPSPALTFPMQRMRPGDGRSARQSQRKVWFDGRWRPTAFYQRERLRPGDRFPGPAVITEYSATTVLPPGWRARVDAWQNMILERSSAAACGLRASSPQGGDPSRPTSRLRKPARTSS
ncbi:MAG: hypothetical protein ACRD2D_02505 [Terriglobales bacterium]